MPLEFESKGQMIVVESGKSCSLIVESKSLYPDGQEDFYDYRTEFKELEVCGETAGGRVKFQHFIAEFSPEDGTEKGRDTITTKEIKIEKNKRKRICGMKFRGT